MRFVPISVLLAITLSFTANTAEEQDRKYYNQVILILSQNATDIRVLGMLKFCQKAGLEKPILDKIAKAISSDPTVSSAQDSVSLATKLIQAVDIYSVGVSRGLSLAPMNDAQRSILCVNAISSADAALAEGD